MAILNKIKGFISTIVVGVVVFCILVTPALVGFGIYMINSYNQALERNNAVLLETQETLEYIDTLEKYRETLKLVEILETNTQTMRVVICENYLRALEPCLKDIDIYFQSD